MSNEIGTLVVVVLKARNLNDKHTLHKQDVFARVALNGPPKETAVDVRGGQHPVWDEEIRIPVPKDPSEKNRSLEISCWAKEYKVDDLLGQGKVDITGTLRTGEFDDWIKLETDGGYRGEVFLEMTFYANAPAPVNRRASKLDPSTRLTRPTQLYKYPHSPSPPNSGKSSPGKDPKRLSQTSPKENNLVLPSSRSSSSFPKSRNDPLPPLPEARTQVPATSAIAASVGTRKHGPPSILRPGNPKSSPIPIGPSPPNPPIDDRQYESRTGYHRPAAHSPSQSSDLPSPYFGSGSTVPTLLEIQAAGFPDPYEITSGVSFPAAAIGNAHSPVCKPQYTHLLSQQPTAYQSSTRTAQAVSCQIHISVRDINSRFLCRQVLTLHVRIPP